MTTRTDDDAQKQIEERQNLAMVLAEIGVPDQLPFAGSWGTHKNELIDNREVSIDAIRTMVRRDGTMRALLRVLSLPLRTASPTFVPNEPVAGGRDGEEEAEFVKDALTLPAIRGGMSRSLERTFASMAWALADGYAVFEKVWQITPEGKLTYRKFAPRAAKTCKFILDTSGGLRGVRQKLVWQNTTVDVTIPADKVLVYTAQDEANPWYGESYFLPAFTHYDAKQKLYYLSHIAHQFRAVPGRVGSIPPSADKKAITDFRRALANMAFNSSMTKPMSPADSDAWAVQFFGQEGTMPDFAVMLNHHNAEASKSVLAQFLSLGTGSETGSWALSSDQSDLLLMALETILGEWAELFNYYAIPQLVDYNFGTGAYPSMQLGPLADSTKQMIAEVFNTLASASTTQVTPEFMFELEKMISDEMGLEIDYDALEERMKREAEMQENMAQAAAKALIEGGGPKPPNEDDPDKDPEQSVAASEIMRIAGEIG